MNSAARSPPALEGALGNSAEKECEPEVTPGLPRCRGPACCAETAEGPNVTSGPDFPGGGGIRGLSLLFSVERGKKNQSL